MKFNICSQYSISCDRRIQYFSLNSGKWKFKTLNKNDWLVVQKKGLLDGQRTSIKTYPTRLAAQEDVYKCFDSNFPSNKILTDNRYVPNGYNWPNGCWIEKIMKGTLPLYSWKIVICNYGDTKEYHENYVNCLKDCQFESLQEAGETLISWSKSSGLLDEYN